MQALMEVVSSRLDLVYFAYAFSFTAMGLLLFVQPRKESSFAISGDLYLLAWFGMVHGANEFMDMWALLRPGAGPYFDAARAAVLVGSFLILLEFGRRALRHLLKETPELVRLPARPLGPALTPALCALSVLTAFFSSSPAAAVPAFARPFLCFTGAGLGGLAFLGYGHFRSKSLERMRARKYFLLAGAGLLAYSALGGLVLPAALPPLGWVPDYAGFTSATGLPVQLFRALCAAVIFVSLTGVVRIFREGALQAAQKELLDIIEFFPDATFVIDSDRKVIAWNRALEHMTGVPKSEVLGRGDFAYAVPFYGVRRPILIDLIGEPHPEAERLYKYVKKRPDGAIYAEVFVPSLYNGRGAHVWVTASPLKNSDGNVYGAIESVRDVTDRKAAEEALLQSEAQYRALIETTNTGFLIIDENGLVLDANREYVRLTGRNSLDELRGRSVLDWTAPYERERNTKAVKRCSAVGYIRNFEVDYITPEGVVMPVELNATVVEIGGKRRIMTLCRDITDRRKAEKLVQESENKFRSLTERSLVGVYLVQDGVFRYANPKLAQIFGYSVDELTDKLGPRDLVLPEDWPTVSENLRRRLDGEIADINYAFRGRRRDGSAIDVEVFGSRAEFGGRPAVLGTLLDITERKRIQDALKESEERYRTLVDNAQAGIVVHKAGIMRFVNSKMAEMVRVKDPAGVIGRSVMEFMHPDYRAFVAKRISDVMASDRPLPPAEERLLAADGTSIDVEIGTVPITYQGERCALAIVQDITARKKAERELLEAKAGLERRVAERTAQLAELNKELEAFSYSAAHDLKAPLRRVSIFSEMLEGEAGPCLQPPQRENLRSIRKAVTQMSELVQGLLALSTTSRTPLEKAPVDLAALAREASAEAAPQGAAVAWDIAPLPVVNCDKAMIKQVLTNLFSNAVKYSRGSAAPRVTVTCRLEGGEHVIGVRDNGVGFNMDYAEKLFGVFQRLHRAEDFEGTGIGLSIVKRIVARHGGRVWAESEPGKGAAFYFTLPADAQGKP
jgi:PAS domain S-box-containing protein